jgi:hypothetical protein
VHAGCRRYRSAAMDTHRYGFYAARYFLGAWCQGAERIPAAAHAAWNPSAEDIANYMASL